MVIAAARCCTSVDIGVDSILVAFVAVTTLQLLRHLLVLFGCY